MVVMGGSQPACCWPATMASIAPSLHCPPARRPPSPPPPTPKPSTLTPFTALLAAALGLGTSTSLHHSSPSLHHPQFITHPQSPSIHHSPCAPPPPPTHTHQGVAEEVEVIQCSQAQQVAEAAAAAVCVELSNAPPGGATSAALPLSTFSVSYTP